VSPRLVERIAHALADAGAEVDVALMRSEQEMAERWPVDGRRVVLAGGDGTLHAAANVAPPGSEMALIPAGRANNVARSLGIPLEPDAARVWRGPPSWWPSSSSGRRAAGSMPRNRYGSCRSPPAPAQPLSTPSGTRRATRRAMPARSMTSTTRSTSL
jgi:Diacylglycerol kinase catalytic domain